MLAEQHSVPQPTRFLQRERDTGGKYQKIMWKICFLIYETNGKVVNALMTGRV